MGTVAIVDYGVGNLKSVANALSYLGCSSCITADPAELERADAIILPGVGAFPDAADRLRSGGLDQHVLAQGQKKPVLGICLGMQLLLEQGREVRPCPGLGVIRGTVDRIPTQSKLPEEVVREVNNTLEQEVTSTYVGELVMRGLKELDEGAYVYFVHSFSAQDTDPAQVIAATDYGPAVTAAVSSGNFYGTQFHPEKSGEVGLTILRNFAGLNC